MEKGIECGIRITKEFLELSDADFENRLMVMLPQVKSSMIEQRKAYMLEYALGSSKSTDDSLPYKTVEFYCSTKGAVDLSIPVEKIGIECGVRIKQFVCEFSDRAFDQYIDGVCTGFRSSVLEQRRIYMNAIATKTAELDDASKGIELYCRTKNFCG
jgi:hypothetical protein